MNDKAIDSLRKLARLYRVSTVFEDGFGVPRHTEPEAVGAVLRSLGASLTSLDDAPEAIRARRHERWAQIVEPVVVSWDGDEPAFVVRVGRGENLLECELEQEDGTQQAWTVRLDGVAARRSIEVEGRTYLVKRLTLPTDIPLGYHRLHLRTDQREADAWVFRAPRKSHPLERVSKSGWGLFLPLYALHTRRSWGAGDFTDLTELAAWTASMGGQVVGTLPLLAAFLDQPFDPSPYTPVSRLFWNELFLDVTAAPEFEKSGKAKELVASRPFQTEIDSLRAGALVDYQRQAALRRKVLEVLSSTLVEGASQRRDEFQAYVDARPSLQAYARFRATTERRCETWRAWPERQRNGHLTGGDYDEQARRYHLYVQWLADGQLRNLAQNDTGANLYLDLPLGVHPGGFDVWREPDSFALGVAGGAPPDRFFTKGQNWGFAPAHPETIRLDGYRHYIKCLRHHMRYSRVLRIDHVMNLHRLYWVPEGFEASQGAYVGYHADEFYAVLAIESQRYGTAIVGEDLGTVPDHVRESMGDHAVRGMHVAQLQFRSDASTAIRPTPKDSLASLNTHDMRPFAGFWKGRDIEDQEDLGLITPEEAQQGRKRRAAVRNAVVRYLRERKLVTSNDPTLQQILDGCLSELAARPEPMMLINLEDLWLEELPQNTPGTVAERPNWRPRARYGLDEVKAMREIEELLRRVHRLRMKSRP
jgi:4-alpha-glucanotransferase